MVKLSDLKAGQDPRTVEKFNSLESVMHEPVLLVLEELERLGWLPIIIEGRRTLAQQQEKVNKGYSKTMKSKHLLGLAVDIVDRRYLWGGPAAKQSFPFWNNLGAAGKRQGFIWGGDWKSFPDVAHLQYKNY